MVLNSVASEHSKRNYAKPLDELYALCEERKQPLSRALLMEYRAAMLEKRLSASTVNVQLSAIRKLIGEAQRNGSSARNRPATSPGYPTSPRRELGWATDSRGTRPRRSSRSLTAPSKREAGLRDFGVAAELRPKAAGVGQLGR